MASFVAGAPAITGIPAVASAPDFVGILVLMLMTLLLLAALLLLVLSLLLSSSFLWIRLSFLFYSVADGPIVTAIVGVPAAALGVLLLETLLLSLSGCYMHPFFAGFPALTGVRAV